MNLTNETREFWMNIEILYARKDEATFSEDNLKECVNKVVALSNDDFNRLYNKLENETKALYSTHLSQLIMSNDNAAGKAAHDKWLLSQGQLNALTQVRHGNHFGKWGIVREDSKSLVFAMIVNTVYCEIEVIKQTGIDYKKYYSPSAALAAEGNTCLNNSYGHEHNADFFLNGVAA